MSCPPRKLYRNRDLSSKVAVTRYIYCAESQSVSRNVKGLKGSPARRRRWLCTGLFTEIVDKTCDGPPHRVTRHRPMTRSRMPSKMSLRTAGPSTLRMEIRSEYKVERELSGFCRRLLSRTLLWRRAVSSLRRAAEPKSITVESWIDSNLARREVA